MDGSLKVEILTPGFVSAPAKEVLVELYNRDVLVLSKKHSVPLDV
jgi:hypothetical protein